MISNFTQNWFVLSSSREIIACGGLIPKEKQSTIKLNFCYIVPILEGN